MTELSQSSRCLFLRLSITFFLSLSLPLDLDSFGRNKHATNSNESVNSVFLEMFSPPICNVFCSDTDGRHKTQSTSQLSSISTSFPPFLCSSGVSMIYNSTVTSPGYKAPHLIFRQHGLLHTLVFARDLYQETVSCQNVATSSLQQFSPYAFHACKMHLFL